MKKPPKNRGLRTVAMFCREERTTCQNVKVVATGLETLRAAAEKVSARAGASHGASQSVSLTVPGDPDLLDVIVAWPFLSSVARRRITGLAARGDKRRRGILHKSR
jgi:hypothetical protein